MQTMIAKTTMDSAYFNADKMIRKQITDKISEVVQERESAVAIQKCNVSNLIKYIDLVERLLAVIETSDKNPFKQLATIELADKVKVEHKSICDSINKTTPM